MLASLDLCPRGSPRGPPSHEPAFALDLSQQPFWSPTGLSLGLEFVPQAFPLDEEAVDERSYEQARQAEALGPCERLDVD